METSSVLVFSFAILCALGSIEALKPESWIEKFVKEGVYGKTISKAVLARETNRDIQEEIVVDCGDHVLVSDQPVVIKSAADFPKNYKCTWNFMGPVGSKISITCTTFVLAKCKKTSLTISGGDFSKKYCLKKPDGFTASSTDNSMKVVFKSKLKKTTQTFQCVVSASAATTTTSPVECKCGRMNKINRIIGGNATQVHQYPWQVALTEGNQVQPYCGGSIISDQWILTAAQCVIDKNILDLRVVIGEHNWSIDTETPVTQRMTISEVIVHLNYTHPMRNNNVALVKLTSPLTFKLDNKIAPVCLPPPEELYEGVNATITGWGAAMAGDGMQNELQEVTIPTWTVNECTSTYGSFIPVDGVICAGPSDDTKDYCTGDLGGALVTAGGPNNTYMIQIGIASVDIFCPFSNFPGFYTRVNSFLDWISGHIDGSSMCSP